MLEHALAGLFLGASLIIAIGAQNAFVLRQGLRGEYVIPIVAVCILCDAGLIVAGAYGLGWLIQSNPFFITFMRWFGAAFLFGYGVMALRRALYPKAMSVDQSLSSASLKTALLNILAVSLLNPHVYLDTVVLLGGIANQRHGIDKNIFVLGAVTASTIWFTALGFGARFLQPLFAKPIAWRMLDGAIAAIMFMIALGLII